MCWCIVYECKASYDTEYSALDDVIFGSCTVISGHNKETGPVEYCKDVTDGKKIPKGSDPPSGRENLPMCAVTYVPGYGKRAFTSNPEQMPRQQSVPSGPLGSPTDAASPSSKDPAATHNLARQQNFFAGYEFEWPSPQSGRPPPSAG
ncbi:hypothetical protein DL771_000009 [Monosporascus sp. 5C6A]|nr:hypothetical protein DL771_000009 [Monosporascus sp. 5C6A]